jgi:thioredoxin reductase
MAVDTPARIAIIGAGPIGLEAALYARFLGYDVDLFERGVTAANVGRWGHVQMFSPFAMNSSTLGLAALAAQDPHYVPPAADSILSGNEWRDRYLLPLSQSDLLADCLHCHTEVVRVAKAGLLKSESVGGAERDDGIFRILIRDAQGRESIQLSDVLIDCSGTFNQPNWLGDGGIPALGEVALHGEIEYGVPDLAGRDATGYLGQRVLVVGSGYSAATSVLQLERLLQQSDKAELYWVTRCAEDVPPLPRIAADPLIERDRIGQHANRVARNPSPRFQYLPDRTIDEVRRETPGQPFQVRLRRGVDGAEQSLTVDRIVANVGYRPDLEFTRELQVHYCYASEGPMRLAAHLSAAGHSGNETGAESGRSGDCLRLPSAQGDMLRNPEPHFYLLGAKSFGRNPHFLIRSGLDQIREVFKILGDRDTLDLYSRPGPLGQ